MTPNSENAMARFLMAILNQKNLKDIDWNAVASDPVLLQPITNGHAARMRYTRFRDTVKGHEPQKRTRAEDKSRVTKSKKTQKPKNHSLAKSNSAASLASYAQAHQSPLVKQEHNPYLAQFSPASTSSPYLTDNRDDFNHRFLTPCSDDMPQGLAINPASLEDLRMRNGFGPSMDSAPDFMAQQPLHDPIVVEQSPFHTFDTPYDLNSCKPNVGNDLDPNGTSSLADYSPEWMDHFNDTSF
ncbi:hypothetical protein FLAG1_00270 [Fusarium langsethiae]|uniref:Myb-like DNA-binding domain-containing protein n=1 Tax=Fusarium langsethiae TaxID=179993 RepID=A0A0N0DIA6_FUSLA|nr:hypothetical protein FLAG1_00270 [Fusarium langsethiae]GKU00462.1 unnamed protein product [Fusarium langsethiae]GKU12961.1 unnamed protein product [Fusarium langsethiae]